MTRKERGAPALTLPPGPETGLDGTQMTCPLSQKERGNLFSAYWYKIQLTRLTDPGTRRDLLDLVYGAGLRDDKVPKTTLTGTERDGTSLTNRP